MRAAFLALAAGATAGVVLYAALGWVLNQGDSTRVGS